MKRGTIVSVTGWHDQLTHGTNNYGIVVRENTVLDLHYIVCMVRGPSEGRLLEISGQALKVEKALPGNDREGRLDKAVRIAKLTFMSYQLQHERKGGVGDDKALANAALVDLMNEALLS